jgi:hypothetical protein
LPCLSLRLLLRHRTIGPAHRSRVPIVARAHDRGDRDQHRLSRRRKRIAFGRAVRAVSLKVRTGRAVHGGDCLIRGGVWSNCGAVDRAHVVGVDHRASGSGAASRDGNPTCDDDRYMRSDVRQTRTGFLRPCDKRDTQVPHHDRREPPEPASWFTVRGTVQACASSATSVLGNGISGFGDGPE